MLDTTINIQIVLQYKHYTSSYVYCVSNSVKGVQDKSTWDIVSQNE